MKGCKVARLLVRKVVRLVTLVNLISKYLTKKCDSLTEKPFQEMLAHLKTMKYQTGMETTFTIDAAAPSYGW